jgi:multiple antibiotic resistance protein
VENLAHELFLSFVPLFFAMDAIGIMPLYLAITTDLPNVEVKRLLRDALLTAFVVAVTIMLTGKFLFKMLGITADDFRIGGGIVLLLIAIMDLLFSNSETRRKPGDVGVVPIGVPLIVGPGAMTTTMMSADKHGYLITLISLVLNLIVVGVVFGNSKFVVRVIGPSGAKAFGKVASLFLAAIAVMMIRVGIFNFMEGKL